METILIGKPYTLRWLVNTNGEQLSLAGRDIKLYITTPKGVVVDADGHWHASENNIVLSIWQDFQYDYGSGCYSMKIIENEGKDGETSTLIDRAFSLTYHNDEVGDDEEDAEGNIIISVDEAISIADIVQMTTSTESEGENVIKVLLTNGRVKTFVVRNGKQGLRGLRGLKGNDGDACDAGNPGITEEEKQILLDAVEDINEAILESNAATQQASKVNAEIVGDKLFVTNKYGVTKSYQLLPSGNEGEVEESGNTGSDGGVCECEPYDDTEIRTMINGKQDAINDLSTIRSGASAGATALQPVTGMGLTHNDFTDAYKNKVEGALQKPSTNGIAGQMLVLNNEGKLVWQNVPTSSETPGDADGCTCTPYDDTAIRQLIAGKQDTISDLSTIRSGASAGATALQPVTGMGLSHNDFSDYYKQKVDNAASINDLNTKQTKLVSGNGIEITSENVINVLTTQLGSVVIDTLLDGTSTNTKVAGAKAVADRLSSIEELISNSSSSGIWKKIGAEKNKYIDISTGTLKTIASHSVSNEFELIADTKILTHHCKYTQYISDVAFYDSTHAYVGSLKNEDVNLSNVSYISILDANDMLVKYPSAKYVRVCYYGDCTAYNFLTYVIVKDDVMNSDMIERKLSSKNDCILTYDMGENITLRASNATLNGKTFTTNSGDSYVGGVLKILAEKSDRYKIVFELECIEGTNVKVMPNGLSSLEKNVNTGDVITTFGYNSDYVKFTGASTFKILRTAIVYYNDDVRTFVLDDEYGSKQTVTGYLCNNDFDYIVNSYKMMSKLSLRAYGLECSNMFFKDKTYCAFGTSITEGGNAGVNNDLYPDNVYCMHVGGHFGMKTKNFGKGSSYSHLKAEGGTVNGKRYDGNIREELLAMMPEDTMLVSIMNGANGWIHVDDINSTDSYNSIGAHNNAIDYIKEHYPLALIVIGCDWTDSDLDGVRETDMKAIAHNKNVIYADTSYISPRNRQYRSDGTHPNAMGKSMMAQAIIHAAENYIMLNPIPVDKSKYQKIVW